MRIGAALTLIAACGLALSNAETAVIGKANSAFKQNGGGKLSKAASQIVGLHSAREMQCVGAAVSAPVAAPAASSGAATLKMVGLFVLWYGFNAGYNVYNAYVKKDFQFPFAIATLQLFIGLFYAVPLWLTGIRKMPKLSGEDFMRLLPIAMLNAAGHACAVNAMFEKGGGSFTHGNLMAFLTFLN
jgi:Triose-phosphate Transporter family